MRQTRRVIRCLGSVTAAAAVMVAAAVLVPPSVQATVTFRSSSTTLGVQNSTPSGAVGGVQSPMQAGSMLNLLINASEAGGGVASAHASIDGDTASVSLCSAPPCPEAVSSVPLSVDVGGAGSNVLVVSVTDAAGNTATLVEKTIEVFSPAPPGSNTVTIGIGTSGALLGVDGPPEGGPPGGGRGGEGGRGEVVGSFSSTVCRWPMLSMRLVSRPLRRVELHGRRAALRAGRRHRYRGTLTCLPAGARHRVPAPDGTAVRVLYEIGRRTFTAGGGTMVVHGGRLSAVLWFERARTIVFRYRGGDGELVQVRIPVAIAHLRRGGRGR